MIASTPKPPYYAVIFTAVRAGDDPDYAQTAARMVGLAVQQPGFLGVEHAGDTSGITVSYWKDLDSIRAWKQHAEHIEAQRRGARAGTRASRRASPWWNATTRSRTERASPTPPPTVPSARPARARPRAR
ncbi:antibiotic biosynthesis monooxygenase family protein [Phenylobacterium sp.]|uniref:antibiotic biosynthesis monooxygenase family protein n=1 Tax=Phenylobacterium sp. TaxID=1871053 RepID=UPI003FA7CB61